MHAKSFQSCATLCDPTDCSPLGFSVHGILQARILEWVSMLSSRGSSRPRDWTCVSCDCCIESEFFTAEPLGKPKCSTKVKWISLISLFLFKCGYEKHLVIYLALIISTAWDPSLLQNQEGSRSPKDKHCPFLDFLSLRWDGHPSWRLGISIFSLRMEPWKGWRSKRTVLNVDHWVHNSNSRRQSVIINSRHL